MPQGLRVRKSQIAHSDIATGDFILRNVYWRVNFTQIGVKEWRAIRDRGDLFATAMAAAILGSTAWIESSTANSARGDRKRCREAIDSTLSAAAGQRDSEYRRGTSRGYAWRKQIPVRKTCRIWRIFSPEFTNVAGRVDTSTKQTSDSGRTRADALRFPQSHAQFRAFSAKFLAMQRRPF